MTRRDDGLIDRKKINRWDRLTSYMIRTANVERRKLLEICEYHSGYPILKESTIHLRNPLQNTCMPSLVLWIIRN